jgi:hypothetical protein
MAPGKVLLPTSAKSCSTRRTQLGDHVDLLQFVKAPAPRARELDWPSLIETNPPPGFS